MALLEDILTWSSDLPDWQRDALRRIFVTDGQLAEKDLEEIRAMAEGVVGAPTPTPLSKSHIPTMGSIQSFKVAAKVLAGLCSNCSSRARNRGNSCLAFLALTVLTSNRLMSLCLARYRACHSIPSTA